MLPAHGSSGGTALSGNSQQFVGLQRKTPLRMGQTIGRRRFGVGGAALIVHRLQEEMRETLARETLRRRLVLGINKLQFVAALELLFRIGFGADADPIDARR